MEEKKIELSLREQTLDLIMQALLELPAKYANPILQDIHDQWEPQRENKAAD